MNTLLSSYDIPFSRNTVMESETLSCIINIRLPLAIPGCRKIMRRVIRRGHYVSVTTSTSRDWRGAQFYGFEVPEGKVA